MVLTGLNGTKMLFAYAIYENSDLKYRVFDGTSWSSVQSASGTNMGTNTVKQISADTVNSTRTAYVAYLSLGSSGTMHVARFSNITGSFEATETVVGTGSHYLPSITITYDDTIHVYCIFNNKIYETIKNSTGWQNSTTPYGDVYDSPDQLTAQVAGLTDTGAAWMEGASSPYTLMMGGRSDRVRVYTNCWHEVWNVYPCSYSYTYVSGKVFTLKTPDWKYHTRIIPCNNNGKWYFCVNTDLKATNPTSMTVRGKQFNLVYAHAYMSSSYGTMTFNPWYGTSSTQNIWGAPIATIKLRHVPVDLTATWLFQSIDPKKCTCDWILISVELRMKAGYW